MPNEPISKPKTKLSDDDLAWSMVVFMEEHGAERMLQATKSACHRIAAKTESEQEKGATAHEVWDKAGKLVGQAAEILKGH